MDESAARPYRRQTDQSRDTQNPRITIKQIVVVYVSSHHGSTTQAQIFPPTWDGVPQNLEVGYNPDVHEERSAPNVQLVALQWSLRGEDKASSAVSL